MGIVWKHLCFSVTHFSLLFPSIELQYFSLSWQYFSFLFVFPLIFLEYLSHCSNQNLYWMIQSYLTTQGTINFSFILFHVFSVDAFEELMVVHIKATAPILKSLGNYSGFVRIL